MSTVSTRPTDTGTRAASTRTGTRSSAMSAQQAAAHQAAGRAVVSVDAKKKENVGNFKNGGREWRQAGTPSG